MTDTSPLCSSGYARISTTVQTPEAQLAGSPKAEAGGSGKLDAGTKVKARKRQAMVDTDRRALALDPQSASIRDREGAVPVLHLSRRSIPFVTKAMRALPASGRTATLIDIEIREAALGSALQSIPDDE